MDGVVVEADEAELAEVVDGEEGFLREAAYAEGDHEFGAAGEEGVLAGVGGEGREDGCEGGWGGEGELGGIGAHREQTVEGRQWKV